MKKNLKKVISAVIALALSIGSVASAATFTDVADTASSAQAINTLAALGVIAGYEDGSFKPDNNITRAEVATMVVAALNRSADAEGAKGTTKFADVNTDAKAWASGFVNIGVTEGFISGYEDGSFKPDNNVTFAEMVSMLVRVAGYGRYAEYLGGWPNGYLSVGNDKGITKNVSAGADVAVTRAQVAQMIYNTLLDVPMVESTTLTTDSNGNLVPEMTIMDGKNDNEYKTLLTEKHNAYYVEGAVTATNRTNSAKYDADEVEFEIQYTENYDDSDIVIKKNARDSYGEPITQKVDVYVGETNAAAYLFTYASAIIKIDEYDDATIVDFVPSGKNDVVSFDTILIDDEDYGAGENVFGDKADDKTATIIDKAYVRYFDSKDADKSIKYNLAKSVDLYVNGVEVTLNKGNFDKYVVNNTSGVVEYIDRYSAAAKADGDYDLINVTYYGTAIVSAVNANSGKISFDKTYNTSSYITLDPEDDEIVYEIIYNGEEIDVAALQEDDVLSIIYDVTATTMNESDFFEIIVSRDTAEGKILGKDSYDEVIKIGDASYEFVQGYAAMESSFNFADEYTVYLDAFGRVFDYELLASSAKLAVIDKFAKSSADDYYRALLYTTDGTTKNLEVDTTKVTFTIEIDTDDDGDADVTLTGNDALLYYTYNDKDGNYAISSSEQSTDNKNPIETRVVKYKVSSSTGRITELTAVAADKSASTLTAFKQSSSSIGGIKMSDATYVIDAIEYNEGDNTYAELEISSLAGFVDDGEYIAYGYDKNVSSGTHNLVIVTSAGGNYTYETNFAVLTKSPAQGYDDETGDDIYTMEAFYAGEYYEGETAMVVSDEVEAYVDGKKVDVLTLSRGDIVVFVKNGEGKIKTIDVLLTAKEYGFDEETSNVYKALADAAFKGGIDKVLNLPADSNNWTADWNENAAKDAAGDAIDQSKEITQFVYGAIVDKKDAYFSLASFATAKAGDVVEDAKYADVFSYKTKEVAANNDGGILDIDLNSDTKVYVYDTTKAAKTARFNLGTNADIMATSIAKANIWTMGDEDIIAWNAADKGLKDNVNFAFAKVVDGTATDVFVIMGNVYNK